MMAALLAAALVGQGHWPLWEKYAARFISGDGRVVEPSAGGRTTSEGQAYALLFALVAQDRARFERLLRWTEDNLARGDLAKALPAWKWGRGPDGRWGVLDANSASDADLWLGYALLEAGRLWREPRFSALASSVLAQVDRREVGELPGLGPMLLPGPVGFALDPGRAWRLNPSYLPPQVLQRLAVEVPGRWKAVLASADRLRRAVDAGGLVPDWVVYRAGEGFQAEPLGGYEAIRSYLWAAMLPEGAERDAWLRSTRGLLEVSGPKRVVPETVDVRAALGWGEGPPGFAAVALLQARVRGLEPLATRLARRLARSENGGLYGDPPRYYDQNLALFALGFLEGRFCFAADGRLRTAWEATCGRH
jgi:endoglucanase